MKTVFDDAEYCSQLVLDAIEYRKAKFDNDWDECFRYDEDGSSTLQQLKNDNAIQYKVEIPHIGRNNNKKAGRLASLRLIPTPVIENADSAAANVRAAVLRWAIRVSGLHSETLSAIDDFVSIKTGYLQFRWNGFVGNGVPMAIYCNPKDIYLDPKRRSKNLNRDCGYIADVRNYSQEDLKALWPKYFEDHGFTTIDGRVGNDVKQDDNAQVCIFEGMVKASQQTVVRGILDVGGKRWIEPPSDNGLGVYSYVAVTGRTKRDHAYPHPSNKDEMSVCDLTNFFLSMSVDQAVKNGNQKEWYNANDPLVTAAVKDPNYHKAGSGPYGYQIEPPKITGTPAPNEYLRMASVLMGAQEDVSEVTDVSSGKAPGRMSGRAVGMLQGASEIVHEVMYADFKDAMEIAAVTLDRLCSANMTEYREIYPDPDGPPVHINIPHGHPLFEDMKKHIVSNSPVQAYGAVRTTTKESITSQAIRTTKDAENAFIAQAKAGNQDNTMAVINDLKIGYASVSVRLEPDKTRADRVQSAVMMRNMKSIDTKTFIEEMGFENVPLVYQRLLEENQALALGQQILSDPNISQAVQRLMNDPLLVQLASNPELLGRTKMLINGVSQAQGATG